MKYAGNSVSQSVLARETEFRKQLRSHSGPPE